MTMLARFRVTILGYLPESPPDSEVELRSFRVTRIVEATTATEAGTAAIRHLQAESKFARMADAYGEAPELEVDEVTLDPEADTQAVNRSGYLFFEDE